MSNKVIVQTNNPDGTISDIHTEIDKDNLPSPSNDIIVSEVPRPAFVMTEKRALKCWESIFKAGESMYKAYVELNEGQGWIALGYDNWDDMCFGMKKLAQSSARRFRSIAYVHRDIAALLPAGSDAKVVLDRMPEDAIHELRGVTKDAPEVSAAIVTAFALEKTVPTVRETLEALEDHNLLTIQQQKKLDALRAKNSDIVDYVELAERLVESIRKNLNKLASDGLYGNLNYKDFNELVRDRFVELEPAFVDDNGNSILLPRNQRSAVDVTQSSEEETEAVDDE